MTASHSREPKTAPKQAPLQPANGSSARESEERYRAFIQNSHEGIWRFDLDAPIPIRLKPDQLIDLMYERAYLAEANNAMAAMYGLDSIEELIGARLGDLLVRDDPRNSEYLRAFIASGYTLSGYESHEVDVEGNAKVFRNSLVAVIEDGMLLRAWGTQQDITSQYQTELVNARLQSQQEELIALNKSKDEFISLASHQLRTPASIVKQYIGMVLEGYCGPVPTKQLPFLQIAYDSNERGLQIIDDLLKVARVDAGKVTLDKRKTDVSVLLKKIVEEQCSAFEVHGQRLVLRAPKKHVFLVIDAPRLRMVIENLIDNARKYSLQGKTTTVRLREEGDCATIAIEDQGVGIAKRNIDRLFQKFSRIDNALSLIVGGTGIGLYWAKKIVDLHAGDITVSSRPGKGSVFSISLPI